MNKLPTYQVSCHLKVRNDFTDQIEDKTRIVKKKISNHVKVWLKSITSKSTEISNVLKYH